MCNLKPKNLVGFKSNGMVCCAKRPDPDAPKGEAVEFVDPPADAKVGELITYEGLDGYDFVSPSQIDKRKVVQKALPDLKTDANKVAQWKGHKMMTSAGPVVAPTLADALIS